ncbi:MAG: hypothetical protein LBG15_11540 [Dysgonamonadaceae bacterium]|jgi:hypothetical protein|nr:hypothetical protein [Dysgonamonadaceae bacterium]
MKKVIIVLLLIVFVSCKQTKNRKIENNIFNPILKNEIIKMLEIKNRETNNKDMKTEFCKVIVSQNYQKDGICTVWITLSNNVHPMEVFYPPSDSLSIHINPNATGYTFIENELIVCYLLSDSCSYNLINKKELVPYKDSIPGYPDITKDYSDMAFEAPTCIYKLVGDSLQLIKSEWIDIF